MKCFDLSEVKMIIKQNIISKNALNFKEHRQIFMIPIPTPGYDVRESYQKRL